MGGQTYYGGYIWTNHALQRLKERGLSQEMAWEAFEHPDRFFKGKQSGTVEYQKKFGSSKVTIIARQNESRGLASCRNNESRGLASCRNNESRGLASCRNNEKAEWIVLSCWIDPPLPGSIDDKKKKAYQKYIKTGFWGKFWIEIKCQLFGQEY
ncbi:MAG: hypothetical protein C4584_01935 [Armatimonadetes bacterium]|nr:MAG: hypothetical protein C4584_01935 [Armatimonadota bacterium]